MKLFYRNSTPSKGDPRMSRSEENYRQIANTLKQGGASFSVFPTLENEDGEVLYKNIALVVSGTGWDTEGNVVLFGSFGTITIIED